MVSENLLKIIFIYCVGYIYLYQQNILETQINCLPVKEMNLPNKLDVDRGEYQDQKRTIRWCISESIFTPEACKKSCRPTILMLKNPPLSDHPMNMWQIENLTQHQEKCEHQIKEKDLLPEAVLPDYTYWITARTSNTWSHEKKLEALRKFI